MKTKSLCVLQSCLGLVSSVVCAVVIAAVCARFHWRLGAPLAFAIVLVLLASRFGASISVPGSAFGAMIFAWMLFPPMHTLHIENPSDRDNLAWMILVSVALSYLLYPAPAEPAPVPRSAAEPDALRGPRQKFVGTGEMAEVRNPRQD
jgi:K+-sensing histidine kinase KdpD